MTLFIPLFIGIIALSAYLAHKTPGIDSPSTYYKDRLHPSTVTFIKKAYSKEQDCNKLIKKISNRFAISEQSAMAWLQQVVGINTISK